MRKDLGAGSATELDGASICIQTGTTTELNLADYFHSNAMKYEAVTIETNDEARQNYLAGRCDVFTGDVSGLAATRATLPDPENHVLLPEVISKEPLGPATRQGDDQWSDIVSWVLNATITAEEKGVTSVNVDDMRANSKDPEVLRLLGVEGNQGAELGPERRLGLPDHQDGRQLRRDIRAEHWGEHTDRSRTRTQRAVD